MTTEELIQHIKNAGDQAAQAMVSQYRDKSAVDFWRGHMAMCESIIGFYEANKGDPKTPTELKVVPKDEEPVNEPA